MTRIRSNAIAVIFVSQRNDADAEGYAFAAEAMVAEAERQPGYLGIDSVRGADGLGITVSYWADEASAIAWREHAGHSAIRDQGRADWYDAYDLHVARIERSYDWQRRG